MSIFITGDIHGEMGINRLNASRWPLGSSLTRDDYLVILGDFGLLFSPVQSPAEKWWLDWLSGKPWTTLVIEGNHDNHWRLNDLPRVEFCGAEAGIIADNIYHLRRGEIYEIEGKKILAFGGATSIDKMYRTEGVSWWPEEVPSYADMDRCIESMGRHGQSVDLILAHTCPEALAPVIAARRGVRPYADPTGGMLDYITSSCAFEHFLCGHWHEDVSLGRYHFLYNRIVSAEDLDIETEMD